MRQEQDTRKINTKQEAVIALEHDSPTNNYLGVIPGTSVTREDSIDEFVTAHAGLSSASASPVIPGGRQEDGPAGAGSAANDRRLGSGQVPMIRPGVSRDALTASSPAATAGTNDDEKQELTMAHLHELEATLGLDEAKVREFFLVFCGGAKSSAFRSTTVYCLGSKTFRNEAVTCKKACPAVVSQKDSRKAIEIIIQQDEPTGLVKT